MTEETQEKSINEDIVPGCVFCDIIMRDSPARIEYEDDEVIVFRNRLRWVPVMLLVVPKRHLKQEQLWQNMGHLGAIAVEMGKKLCPNGFRLLSNFGPDALQSQDHAHVHIIGGVHLGEYA